MSSVFVPDYKHTGLDRIGNIEEWLVAYSNGGSIPLIGSTLMAIGDSFTSHGWDTSTSNIGITSDARAWLMWACLYSKGGLTLTAPSGKCPAAATSGYTTQQMIDTHLPTVLAQKPQLCAVLGGLNDISASATVPAIVANLKIIYKALVAAGITPVLCTVGPWTGGTYSEVTALNVWIKRYARMTGYPLVDFHKVLVDTTGDGSTYTSDLTSGDGHPNAAGAKLMGQAFWTAVQYRVAQESYAPLACFNGKVSGDTADLIKSVTSNSLMLTDTNSDGVPDGWTLSGTSATGSIDTASPTLGNYFTITRSTADAFMRTTSAMTNAAVGDRMLMVCELKSSVEGVSGNADCQVCDTAFGIRYAGIGSFEKDIPDGSVISQEFTWTGSSSLTPRFNAQAKAAANATVSVARAALYNLTALGIA